MKSALLVIVSLVITAISCRKSDIANDIPYCIHKEIVDNRNNSNWLVGSVEEYSFQNKTVYAFLPDGRIIADASTIIRDVNCNTLCSAGGFGGPQVNLCNGDNFFQQATLIRTIWIKK